MAEVYAYYGQVEPDLAPVLRDAEAVPAIAEIVAENEAAMVAIRDVLARAG